MDYLYKKLLNYSSKDYYGFHMPGHKRNQCMMGTGLPYHIDITEIEGFDDLHHARGIIREAQERAAALYHADETHYLINGSTAGILSAILGSTAKGDKILIARNCHKSVYHAIYMNELKPVYIYPEYIDDVELNGPVDASKVREILKEQTGVKAVVITSPTYDGVVSDVREIAGVVHEKGIPLIVDEAHGAHFGMHPYFPENSVHLGADVIIHSIHKTLPAFTQTALIHLNGSLADRKRITQYLHMLQTSSPSYVLMAGIDECVRMISEKGTELFEDYVDLLESTRNRLKNLKHLRLIETGEYDRSKIIISVKGSEITSWELSHRLFKQYHLQMEMTAGNYILAMTSVCDTREGMLRFVKALEEIDSGISGKRYLEETDSRLPGKKYLKENLENNLKSYSPINSANFALKYSLPRLEMRYTNAEVGNMLRGEDVKGTMSVLLGESEGSVSTEYAYIYPPGIPLIVPGEVISREAAALIERYESMGFSIEGLENEGKIEVLING